MVSADVGATIRASWTATNGVGSASAETAATAIVAGLPPVNTALPAISGTATDGQTLTSTDGSWTGSAPITYARQWQRCDSAGGNCTAIAGATGTTYALVSADVGATIVVALTASNSAASVAASSVATAVVAGVSPTNTAVPTISGPADDGAELTASTGSWDGTTPIAYTYQWEHCTVFDCQPIDGETEPTYIVDSAYVDERIRVEVAATNAAGSSSVNSAQTAQILGFPPSQTAPMVIDGLVKVDNTISLNVGEWSGTSPFIFNYQWQRCDTTGTTCTDITGAINDDYKVTLSDVTTRLRVVTRVSNRYFNAGYFTSPTSAVVAEPADETAATGFTPVAQPTNPTDAEHLEQTAEILYKLSPDTPPGPCNALCETAAAHIQGLIDSLPPEENAFAPMSKNMGVNRLAIGPTAIRRIATGIGDAIIDSGFAARVIPYAVDLTPAGAVIGGVAIVSFAIYENIPGGPRSSTIEIQGGTGEVPTCGTYPADQYPCPIVRQEVVHVQQGSVIDSAGATMPHDGYVWQYSHGQNADFYRELATCSNLLGLPQTAPSNLNERVDGLSHALCSDLVTSAPTKLAIGPADMFPMTPFSHDPPPPAPNGVILGPADPGTAVQLGTGSVGGALSRADQDLARKQLAHELEPRCNPDPATDTVTVPSIQEGESGQSYASCLATLGLDTTVRAKPIIDADATKLPGSALSSDPGAGAELEPGTPVTVITNPGAGINDAGTGTGGGGSGGAEDTAWLRNIEEGLVAHNPELVASIPNFETEVVPVVALQCAKNVKAAEDYAAQEEVGSTASNEDCGDPEHRGLPMYISGSTTPQATQNDLNGLERNPLWTVLHRPFVPATGNPLYSPSAWFKPSERHWYTKQPGCADRQGFLDPACDEFRTSRRFKASTAS